MFRAAPRNGEYWNNLGVCNMRMMRWDDAVIALRRGVSIGNTDSSDNLSDLTKYLKSIKHPLPPDNRAKTQKHKRKDDDADDDDDDDDDDRSAYVSSHSAAASRQQPSATPDGRSMPRFLPKPVYVRPSHIVPKPRRS